MKWLAIPTALVVTTAFAATAQAQQYQSQTPLYPEGYVGADAMFWDLDDDNGPSGDDVGVESRGFFFGFLLALRLNVPFYPIRKKGKLPYKTYSESYELEYGKAAIEIHQDTIEKGMQVLVHDDLLATGGTMQATAKLIQAMGGELVGFSFIVALDQLKGIDKLLPYSSNIHSLVHYPI